MSRKFALDDPGHSTAVQGTQSHARPVCVYLLFDRSHVLTDGRHRTEDVAGAGKASCLPVVHQKRNALNSTGAET